MTALQTTLNASSADIGGDRPQTIPAQDKSAPAVSLENLAAVFGATLGAFMAVLNIQIVNASLADIQGAIGAGIDDGGWISTILSDRRDHRDSAERLARAGVLDPRLSPDQRHSVPGVFPPPAPWRRTCRR